MTHSENGPGDRPRNETIPQKGTIRRWLVTCSECWLLVVDYHTLRAPITAQLSPTLRRAKRVKKKERWRACADNTVARKNIVRKMSQIYADMTLLQVLP